MLLIAFVKTRIENFSQVSLAIPVGILRVKDFRRVADDDR